MNRREFIAAEAARVARRKDVGMTTRQLIASRTADEIVSLSESGCCDKEIVELIIMAAIVQIEDAAHARFMGDLGRALTERGRAA